MAHTCHAASCGVFTPPEMFMCRRHWFMLPKRLRDEVWRTYRSGQCDDWEISHAYSIAAIEAVRYIGCREGVPIAEIEEACRVYRMLDPQPQEAEYDPANPHEHKRINHRRKLIHRVVKTMAPKPRQ